MVHSCAATFAVVLGLLSTHPIGAAERHPAPLQVVNSQAARESLMKPYDELIEHSGAKIKMLPIPGGQFSMGSPKTEEERQPDEGPQHQVKVSPFWMAECEITWNGFG